jgi:hypothetical protein
MTESALIPTERVEQAIYLIRGHKVMLDRDLAGLYGVETRVLNQAVKRNETRFPDDFMFELTREEIRNISQFVTCSEDAAIKHSKRVLAFTEQGVAMLSGVLKSPRAVELEPTISTTNEHEFISFFCRAGTVGDLPAENPPCAHPVRFDRREGLVPQPFPPYNHSRSFALIRGSNS